MDTADSLPPQVDPGIERLSTGVSGLDTLLHGGLPRQTLCLIAGLPGSGKTVLAMQMACAAARRGEQVLFCSLLADSNTQLIRQFRPFSFFDPTFIGNQIELYNLGHVIEQGMDKTIEVLFATLRTTHPTLVILDSFGVLTVLLKDPAAIYKFLYDLRGRLELLGMTGLVTYEADPDEALSTAGLTVPDALIGLYHRLHHLQAIRYLSIRKLRYTDFVPGKHLFTLSATGISIYPRPETEVTSEASEPATGERAALGLPELDVLLHGGFHRGTSTLLVGNPGTGKTLIGLSYLAAGAVQGEPGVLLGFRESVPQLLHTAKHFGIDLSTFVQQGLIHLMVQPAIECQADITLAHLRTLLEEKACQRLVVDSLAEFSTGIEPAERVSNVYTSLVTDLRRRGMTSIFIAPLLQVVSPSLYLPEAVLPLAENLLLLRQVAVKGELHRVLSIQRVRLSDFDPSMREFTITARGLRVLNQVESEAGILARVDASEHPVHE